MKEEQDRSPDTPPAEDNAKKTAHHGSKHPQSITTRSHENINGYISEAI